MSAANDYTVIVNEVIGKLTLLNQLYFKSPTNRETNLQKFNILGGSINLPKSSGKPTKNIQQLLLLNNYITGAENDNIKEKFIAKPTYNAQTSKVYTYTAELDGNESTYTEKYIASITENLDEINCLALLDYRDDDKNYTKTIDKKTVIDTSKNNTIYNFMQGLYTLYNLFDAKNWELYLSSIGENKPFLVNFNIPAIVKQESSGTATYTLEKCIQINSSALLNEYINYADPTGNLLSTIVESITFNPFVARRIIYLWISLCNYFISIVLLKNTDADGNKTDVANLVKFTYNIIVQSNKSVSYNSIQNTTYSTDIIQNGKLESEEYTMKLVMFQAAIYYIQTGSSNPFDYYTTHINNKWLNIFYDSVIGEENISNQFKYSLLKEDPNKKSEIIKYVTSKLEDLVITIGDNTTATFFKNHKDKIDATIKTLTYQIYSSNAAARALGSSIGVFGDLNKAVGENISFYGNVQDEVNSISGLLKTGKTNLSTIQKLLNGRLSMQKTQQIYEYVAITIFVIFGVAAVSIMVLDIDKQKKLYGCIGLIIFALLNFLGIQTLLNSSAFIVTAPTKPIVESFVDQPAILGAMGVSDANYINYYNISAMDQVSTYLDNTFTLVTLLETYKAYGNINASMEKEVNYYNNIVSQLNNAQSKVNSIYFASYINTIDVSALLQLVQILTILVAVFCTGYVLTDSEQLLFIRQWINIITGILTVISIVIYIIEIKTRVRTNPSKIYWKNPGNKSFD